MAIDASLELAGTVAPGAGAAQHQMPTMASGNSRRGLVGLAGISAARESALVQFQVNSSGGCSGRLFDPLQNTAQSLLFPMIADRDGSDDVKRTTCPIAAVVALLPENSAMHAKAEEFHVRSCLFPMLACLAS